MTDWYQQAACRGATDLFFPPKGSSPRIAEAARTICAGCEVRTECLEAGLWEYHGIWGGTSELDRRPLRIGRTPPPRPIDHGTNAGYAMHHYRNEEPCRECREAHAADRAANKQARRTA